MNTDNKELEKRDSEDSLNFDCDSIEEDVLNQEEISNIIEGDDRNNNEINNNNDINVNNNEVDNVEIKIEINIDYETTNNNNIKDLNVIIEDTNNNLYKEEPINQQVDSINDKKEQYNDKDNPKTLNNSKSNDTIKDSTSENDDIKEEIVKDVENNNNSNNNTSNIIEEEKNKLLQENMLKEYEQQVSNVIYNNSITVKKNNKKNNDGNILKSEDGPHITMLYSSGFSSKKYNNKNTNLKDFLDNIVPRHIKFENGKGYDDDLSLPNVKGFQKPDTLKSYIYRMDQHKDDIKNRKEKIASCYLLSLGHSFPLGHESRKCHDFYYSKTNNTFTKNYLNTTKSKIRQNTEYYHKYIDFDYELPAIISKLPYESYIDFYNSDSYCPQLRRPENKKFYFTNNIPTNSKKEKLLKIPDLKKNNNITINNSCMNYYNIKSSNQDKLNNYSNDNTVNNNMYQNHKSTKKAVRFIDNEYEKNKISKVGYMDNTKRSSAFEAPIVRIKKKNEKLKRIKDIDKIINKNKVDTIYHSKYILSP
ncbi:hypothetical protein BCR36DRAFT_411197 [Piromyces finnis]|uniref:Uncharacterized protein n=1 Tax=Piromyces finnis TaxID=1754191 RepID=A0A1Y1VDL1_9FUNG|nr:hypothetical protein BCR36DRAFT_411197 [Piromyces finnis]|eukprot:ORX53421.1 hypothetical protein BCR36DRAFT_411197 [Piromyces finnis]